MSQAILKLEPSCAAPGETPPLVAGLQVIGINHKTAPVALRELTSFPRGISDDLTTIRERLPLTGIVALSTCNRTEFYWTSDQAIAPMELFQEIARTPAEHLAALEPCLYHHTGIQVVEHLFEVVCGLDSLVVGETQILGQVKRAYERSREKGLTNITLNLLFQRAFEAAKKIHCQTALASDQASIPAVALKLSQAFFDQLEQTNILVIGTGEIARLTVEILHKQGAQKISFLTRTAERARVWEEIYPGTQVRTMDHLVPMLAAADMVIACTRADEPVITPAVVQEAARLRHRPGQPILFLDLGIPRNIDSRVADKTPAYLYNVDDLQKAVEQNRRRVEAELEKARAILAGAAANFEQCCKEAAARETIQEVRSFAQEIAGKELERTLSKLSHLPPQEQEAVAALVHRVLGKILHPPTENLRVASRNGQAKEAVAWTRTLFGLD